MTEPAPQRRKASGKPLVALEQILPILLEITVVFFARNTYLHGYIVNISLFKIVQKHFFFNQPYLFQKSSLVNYRRKVELRI